MGRERGWGSDMELGGYKVGKLGEGVGVQLETDR